uniref:Uncharacterized protein n=1 Tax=Streptomyces autolyticus TaxID=75293 RepID=F1DGL5_9ACTN|nr:hypothetical protein [Streptomyces autolyticus]
MVGGGGLADRQVEDRAGQLARLLGERPHHPHPHGFGERVQHILEADLLAPRMLQRAPGRLGLGRGRRGLRLHGCSSSPRSGTSSVV